MRWALAKRTLRLAGPAALALAALAWTSPNARAAAVLDQQYRDNNSVNNFTGEGFGGLIRAETFTVGVAGTLSEVDVFPSFPATFTGFNILSTSGDIPTSTVLTTGTLALQAGGVAAFSVSLPVSVGEVLAIEPVASGGGGWLANDRGTYAGGGDFFLNPDFTSIGFHPTLLADDFQTFVTVPTGAPEPASLALFGTGLIGLGLIRRRMPKRALALAVGAWACAAAMPAFAGPLNFDFTFSGNSSFPGTVSGEIEGLTNNGTSSATALFITSSTIELPFSSTLNLATHDNVLNSFTVANDIITNINFYSTSGVFFVFILGSAEDRFVNFLTGDQIYNGVGLAGITLTPVVTAVPAPSALALFGTGLVGLGLIRWSRRTVSTR